MVSKKAFQVQVESTTKFVVLEKAVLKLIRRIFSDEAYEQKGSLSLIFVDDEHIQNLNRNYLNHDYPTDVIAFPLDDESDDLWGEVYISVDRAKEQAAFYRESFRREITRLIIHGVLHLMGYDDQDLAQKKKMKAKEENYLSKYSDILI
ncbi:rRNA maturation RNase YbeY [candidate division KSB1 bacterium]|nr:rRNA maturation RNase YbeY [candidate division KSB1 bacterium]